MNEKRLGEAALAFWINAKGAVFMDGIDLGERLESFVSELVSEGRFKDRASVLRQSVRLLEEQELKLRELDLALDEGLADIAASRVHSSQDVRAQLEQRFGAWPKRNEM